jgi:heavy metal sensor kinase
MFSSLRWTLLSWYAVILTVVITGFIATLYVRLERAMIEEVDAALRAQGRAIVAALEPQPQGDLSINLPPKFAGQFKTEGREAGYFIVWDEKQRELLASVLGEGRPYPQRQPPGERADRPWGNDAPPYREQLFHGPRKSLVVVGRTLEEPRRRLAQFLGLAIGSGLAALGVAMVGGWFLAARMLAPIDEMSRAAAAISSGKLSERIDVAQTKTELGRLAHVLNSAFDRLEAAYAEQVRFTADASHELRTPLAVLIANAALLLRRDRTPEEYRESLQTTLDASQRMQGVVEGMLTLARADVPRDGRPSQAVDLQKLVQDACSLFLPLAEQQQVTFTRHLEPVQLPGDEEHLRQIVTNLVSNAINYSPQATVHVRLVQEADEAVLTVADTGVGIPAADLPHIFERFYRVDKARSRRDGGSGLGLAIVHALVTAMGGSVTCTSQEGAGTTFVVRLPLVPDEVKPPAAPEVALAEAREMAG